MKKKFLFAITAVLLLQTSVTNGQGRNIDSKKLRFGAYIAPTLSWMRPTTSKSNDGVFAATNEGSKLGFTYGLMAEYHFADNYALATGLQINMTGGKIRSERVNGNTTEAAQVNTAMFNYNLNYLEIPVALKMRTDLISGFRFFGQLGLTTGFNIAKKATYEVHYTDREGKPMISAGEKEKVKGTLAIAPVMFQMNIGAGAEYPLNEKLCAYAGIFFNNGFAPDATNPNKYDMPYKLSFKDGNTRLNNFALRLGIFF
jgi:hypothetical protein